jgi:hypothetical protein
MPLPYRTLLASFLTGAAAGQGAAAAAAAGVDSAARGAVETPVPLSGAALHTPGSGIGGLRGAAAAAHASLQSGSAAVAGGPFSNSRVNTAAAMLPRGAGRATAEGGGSHVVLPTAGDTGHEDRTDSIADDDNQVKDVH